MKWSPFSADVPVEALHITPRMESFFWRIEQLVGEGGFALVTAALGKSVTLRVLAERLAGVRDVQVGILSRPQAGLADFYRELGELFGVELHPHTAGAAQSCCASAGNRTSTPRSAGPCSSSIYVDRLQM